MNYYAIIVAGGSGNRMNHSVPKQFLLLQGRPVLMHTIEVFYNCRLKPEIIVVIGLDYRHEWFDLCIEHNFTIPHTLANSGDQRFHSVKNGLSMITHEGIVAVHDAARPLVSPDVVLRSFEFAEAHGNCVAGITLVDSIRSIADNGSTKTLDRAGFRLVQTPQTFRVLELKAAYSANYSSEYTDDASVMENYGVKINIIEGNRENIKITYPEDLEIASLLLKRMRP